MHAIGADNHIALDFFAVLESGRCRKRIDIDDTTARPQHGRWALEFGVNCASLQLFVQMNTVTQEPWLSLSLGICTCLKRETAFCAYMLPQLVGLLQVYVSRFLSSQIVFRQLRRGIRISGERRHGGKKYENKKKMFQHTYSMGLAPSVSAYIPMRRKMPLALGARCTAAPSSFAKRDCSSSVTR